MPTIDILLPGFAIDTDQGYPAFCGVFLVRGSDAAGQVRNILVDAAHVGRRPHLWDALAARQLTAADIDTVVLTHAHWDHVQNIDLFPHATLLIHADERRYAHTPHTNDWATPAWTGLLLEQLPVASGLSRAMLAAQSSRPPRSSRAAARLGLRRAIMKAA